MMRRWFIGIGAVILFLVQGGNFPSIIKTSSVFAAEPCATCEESPKELQNYLDAMQELIDLLPIEEQKTDKKDDKTSSGRKLNTDAAKIESIQQNTLAPHITFVNRTFADLKMVYETASIVRDYEKITSLGDDLAERVVKMALANRHDDDVPTAVWDKVDKALKKIGYMSLKKEGKDYSFDIYHVKYITLAEFMRNLHQMYEIMHQEKWYRYYLDEVGKWFTKTDDKDTDTAIREIDNEKIVMQTRDSWDLLVDLFGKWENDSVEVTDFFDYVSFSKTGLSLHIRQIHDDYRCTIGLKSNTCNTVRKDMRKDMKDLKKKTVHDGQRARNTFLTSWSRLKWLFNIWSKDDKAAARQRKTALTERYWWSDFSTNKTAWWDIAEVSTGVTGSPLSIEGAWKWIKNAWKSFSNPVASNKDTVADKNKSAKEADNAPKPSNSFDYKASETVEQKKAILGSLEKELTERERRKYDYMKNYGEEGRTEYKKDSFKSAFQDVFDMQTELQVKNVFIDVRSVTQRFPALSAVVYDSVNLIWDKNTKGALYHSMGEVCDAQCTNLWGKICWSKLK